MDFILWTQPTQAKESRGGLKDSSAGHAGARSTADDARHANAHLTPFPHTAAQTATMRTHNAPCPSISGFHRRFCICLSKTCVTPWRLHSGKPVEAHIMKNT